MYKLVYAFFYLLSLLPWRIAYVVSEDGETNTLAASILKKQGIHNNRVVKGGWQSVIQLKDKFTIEVTKEKKANDSLDAL